MVKLDGLVSLLRNLKPPASDAKCNIKTLPKPSSSSLSTPLLLRDPIAPASTNVESGAGERLKQDISSILNGSYHREKETEKNHIQDSDTLKKKEKARQRKAKWFAKHCRIDRVISMSSRVLGCQAIEVLEKLGREAKENEYISLIHLCLEEAKKSNSESNLKDCIDTMYNSIKAMKKKGFPVKEDTYGPILLFMIDNKMSLEFRKLCVLLDDNDNRLRFYEFRLLMHLNGEEQINNLCKSVTESDDCSTNLRENYLIAACETDRRETLRTLLRGFNVTLVSSLDNLILIFRALGRLKLESIGEDLLSSIKGSSYESNMPTIISEYACSILNISAEEKVARCEHLYNVLNLKPTFESYEVVVNHCCDLAKVHLAVDIVEKMNEEKLFLSSTMVLRISRACDDNFEFTLVKRMYSLICRQRLKLDNATFRSLISLCVKTKDFNGAFEMVNDMKKMGLKPYSGIYNVIMGGFFREKDVSGALRVLNQMEEEGIEPDSSTYSYLIGNCDTEEKLIQFHQKMKSSGVKQLKQVFIARINAYVSCGEYEKAKQVLLEEEIPISNLNEIKSKLIQALACHGQSSGALLVYQEMKTTGCVVDPKAIVSLIEFFPTEGTWKILVELLDDLKTHEDNFWVDGCYRVITYCVARNNFRLMIRILKQLVEKFRDDEVALEFVFDEVFSDVADLEPADVDMGLKLLRKIKSEFGVSPSRKCLDFMMQACVNAKSLENTLKVWNEYQLAALPYNVLTYLRMYQALLACGSVERATKLRNQICRDDFHVCLVLSACSRVYGTRTRTQ